MTEHKLGWHPETPRDHRRDGIVESQGRRAQPLDHGLAELLRRERTGGDDTRRGQFGDLFPYQTDVGMPGDTLVHRSRKELAIYHQGGAPRHSHLIRAGEEHTAQGPQLRFQ